MTLGTAGPARQPAGGPFITITIRTAGSSEKVLYQMMPMNLFLIGILFGVYGLFSLARKRFGEIFIGIALSVLYTLVIMMAANFFFRAFSYSRSVLLVTAVYELVLLGGWMWFMWRLERMQDGKGQGEGAMKVALAALRDEDPEPYTKIPFVLATPENIADFE